MKLTAQYFGLPTGREIMSKMRRWAISDPGSLGRIELVFKTLGPEITGPTFEQMLGYKEKKIGTLSLHPCPRYMHMRKRRRRFKRFTE
ncbi:hypothetical protein AN958_00079 [Leucoagaricus sp. SymC.cos]|nr:hypothetical protein AN958_00079 [Leucoagaricus sp. SymC.cos]